MMPSLKLSLSAGSLGRSAASTRDKTQWEKKSDVEYESKQVHSQDKCTTSTRLAQCNSNLLIECTVMHMVATLGTAAFPAHAGDQINE
jgi:hypothetical protein